VTPYTFVVLEVCTCRSFRSSFCPARPAFARARSLSSYIFSHAPLAPDLHLFKQKCSTIYSQSALTNIPLIIFSLNPEMPVILGLFTGVQRTCEIILGLGTPLQPCNNFFPSMPRPSKLSQTFKFFKPKCMYIYTFDVCYMHSQCHFL
jgi:hypothetical protein